MKKFFLILATLFMLSVPLFSQQMRRLSALFLNNVNYTGNYARNVEYNVERSGRIGVWFTHSNSFLMDVYYFTPSFGNSYSAEIKLSDTTGGESIYKGRATRNVTNTYTQWDVNFVADGQQILLQFILDN